MSDIRIVTSIFSILFAMVALFISASLRARLGSYKDAKKPEERIFISMTDLLIICGILNPFASGLSGVDLKGQTIIITLAYTVCMVLYLFIMFLWMNFVDFKFFHSKSRVERLGKKAFIPLVIMLVLLVVNLPTNILFYIRPDNVVVQRPLWLLGISLQLFYLFYTLTLVRKYKKLYGGLHFFSIKSFIIPFVFGFLLQLAMRDWVFVTLAAAIGLTNIYIELMEEKVYIDPVTGLYNSYFLDRIFEEIKAGDYDFKSAILFKLTGNNDDNSGGVFLNLGTTKAISKTIDEIMPEGCETMYLGGGELLVLTKVKSDQEAAVKLLCMMFGESLKNNGYDDYTVDHSYAFREEGQSADEFLRKLGEKEEVAA